MTSFSSREAAGSAAGNGASRRGAFALALLGAAASLTLSASAMAQETIQIISHRYPALEFLTQKIAEALPEMPGEVSLMPIDQATEKATITLAAGSDALDIVYVNEPMMGRFAKAGWLEPLDAYWEKYKAEYNLDDIPPSAVDALRYDGKLYAMPFSVNVMFFFYRKDLFEEAGLEPPTTFDEYLAVAEQLNSPQRSGTVLTLKPVDAAMNETHWYLNTIGDGWFDDNMKPVFNSENGIKAIETLKAVSQFAPRGFTAHANDESTIAFQQDFAAMGLQWLTRAAAMDDEEKSRVVGKIDWAVPPGGHTRISISGYGISKFSAVDKDKLFQILAIGSSAESQAEAAALSMPLRRSVLNDPQLAKQYRHFQPALAAIEVAEPLPGFPEFIETAEIVTRYVLQAVTGELPTKEAMDTAAVEVEELLESRGYYN
jgi:ABC-type glycerol-3-phosphate transport system substrate-binding protein